jgi:hypothetical protein
MMRSPGRLLWLVVAAAPLLQANFNCVAAQAGPSAESLAHSAMLSGIVTKAPGREPVKKAVIELIAESQSESGNYTAQTAADGTFQIEGIAPGRYHLFVERTGYLEVDKHGPRTDGRVLTLAAGQNLKDLVIRLQAAAVVEGRVTDEDGDPLANAQVTLLRQTFASGRSHWEQVGAERTNDLGEYRIAGLASGSYYISVTPPPDFRSLIEVTGNASAAPRPDAAEKPAPPSYQTTYYPGTRDRSQAASIQLHAGDEFPANFSLTPSPALMIRGVVTGLAQGASAAIMLQSKDFSLVLNGADVRKDGSFEIRDVTPGAYTILATVEDSAVPLMARQNVQVTSENVDGLRLTPQPGSSVRGRARVSSASSRLDFSQFFFTLRSADGDDDVLGALTMGSGFATQAHVNADGSFEWKSVPPGHYYVQLSHDGVAATDWFLKSVAAGSSDITSSGFSVNGNTVALDVVVSANGGIVEGAVVSAKGEPSADTVIVAVPETRFRGNLDRYRKILSDQGGRFTMRALPPGDYTLYAWESIDGDAYYNSDFLKQYEGQGTILQVGEGEHKSLQLQIIPSVRDQPTDQP